MEFADENCLRHRQGNAILSLEGTLSSRPHLQGKTFYFALQFFFVTSNFVTPLIISDARMHPFAFRVNSCNSITSVAGIVPHLRLIAKSLDELADPLYHLWRI